MLRSIIVLHRYAGVIIGTLMTLWCLSGFVMMYQSFPELTSTERLEGLAPLPAGCCSLAALPIANDAAVTDARLEMAAGAPVIRVTRQDEQPVLFDATTGAPKAAFTPAETLAIARTFGERSGVGGAPTAMGVIDADQWTVALARRNGPVHWFAFDDPKATGIYVSGASGEVFQDTTRRERVLSWFGAIPHWLYPTILRQNPASWTQVVIWTSTLGVFLTVTGLYVGISRIGKGRGRQVSPYKGLWFWHHMTGLVFGILTLTWVFSGLLTMNPWGFLESDAGDVRGKLNPAAPWSDVKEAMAKPLSEPAVQLTTAQFAGHVRLLSAGPDGHSAPVDGARPITRQDVGAAFARAGLKVSSLELIDHEDAYYYGHHGEVPLPVWRAQLSDAEQTRVYIDASSGRTVRAVDAPARQARWLSSALHDFDWPVIRRRPIWDFVVLPLLLGVTVATALGTWLGWTRLGRDLRAIGSLRRRRRKPVPAGAATSGPAE